MEPLIQILKRAPNGLAQGWLYLPAKQPWQPDTLGQIIYVDTLPDDQVDEDEEPLIAAELGLVATLESAMIESIVASASQLTEPLTDELLLESFQYYYDYDAFLPYSGYQPPSRETWQQQRDRDFYDCLGQERLDQPCKNSTCQRGAIEGSVFCKVHHFEMIQHKPCPFSD